MIRLHDPRELEHARALELWEHWARTGVIIIAPMLLRYEVTNAIYRLVRFREMSDEVGRTILELLEVQPIEYVDTYPMHLEAFEFARRFNTKTSYDGHYVALARQEGVPLITADKKLVNISRPHFPFVRYVMDEEEPAI